MKEIIIDGVNVAGCNSYKEGHCLDKTAILLCDTNKCSNYKDCYYKQLKRLEQENEELKNRLQILDDKILTVEITVEEFENYKQLKQENEELKKLKCKFKEYCTCDTERYRFALEEIREIANQTIIDYTEIAKNNEKLKALDIRNRMSEIQNIISETIGE